MASRGPRLREEVTGEVLRDDLLQCLEQRDIVARDGRAVGKGMEIRNQRRRSERSF